MNLFKQAQNPLPGLGGTSTAPKMNPYVGNLFPWDRYNAYIDSPNFSMTPGQMIEQGWFKSQVPGGYGNSVTKPATASTTAGSFSGEKTPAVRNNNWANVRRKGSISPSRAKVLRTQAQQANREAVRAGMVRGHAQDLRVAAKERAANRLWMKKQGVTPWRNPMLDPTKVKHPPRGMASSSYATKTPQADSYMRLPIGAEGEVIYAPIQPRRQTQMKLPPEMARQRQSILKTISDNKPKQMYTASQARRAVAAKPYAAKAALQSRMTPQGVSNAESLKSRWTQPWYQRYGNAAKSAPKSVANTAKQTATNTAQGIKQGIMRDPATVYGKNFISKAAPVVKNIARNAMPFVNAAGTLGTTEMLANAYLGAGGNQTYKENVKQGLMPKRTIGSAAGDTLNKWKKQTGDGYNWNNFTQRALTDIGISGAKTIEGGEKFVGNTISDAYRQGKRYSNAPVQSAKQDASATWKGFKNDLSGAWNTLKKDWNQGWGKQISKLNTPAIDMKKVQEKMEPKFNQFAAPTKIKPANFGPSQKEIDIAGKAAKNVGKNMVSGAKDAYNTFKFW